MQRKNAVTENAIKLADKIEEQIRKTDLAPGAPLKKTKTIAKENGVSTSCANLAMRLLVQRRLVERRPRTGTIVADYHNCPPSPIDKIYFMVPRISTGVSPELLNNLILGLQSVFPRAEIGITYYETDGTLEVRELIDGKPDKALILIRASLSLQRLTSSSGLPCVVLGQAFPSVNLPWLDVDSAMQGNSTADFILSHPNASALLLMQNRIAPGDHIFLDAVRKKLLSARWELSQLTERFIPMDTEVVEITVKEYLDQHPNHPSVIIAPGKAAAFVLETIEQLKKTPQVSVVGIRGIIGNKLPPTAKCTVIEWKIDLYALGVELGNLLLERITNGKSCRGKSVFPEKTVSKPSRQKRFS